MRFQCYLMDSIDDAEAVAHTYWLRERTRFPDLPEMIQESSVEEAKHFLARTKGKYFVLWDAQQKRVIGKTCINRPIGFTDSLIAEDMQRLGLADILYDARFKYIQESSFHRFVFAKIAHMNAPSIEAATRNGFKKLKLFGDFNSAYYFRYVPGARRDPLFETAREAVFEDPKARPRSLDR